jgi:hypothetical protein
MLAWGSYIRFFSASRVISSFQLGLVMTLMCLCKTYHELIMWDHHTLFRCCTLIECQRPNIPWPRGGRSLPRRKIYKRIHSVCLIPIRRSLSIYLGGIGDAMWPLASPSFFLLPPSLVSYFFYNVKGIYRTDYAHEGAFGGILASVHQLTRYSQG